MVSLPIALISRLLKHTQACIAMGTLIVLLWRSAVFWPLLCHDRKDFGKLIEDWDDLPMFKCSFLTKKSGEHQFKGALTTIKG